MSITAQLCASPNPAESAGKWPNPRRGWREDRGAWVAWGQSVDQPRRVIAAAFVNQGDLAREAQPPGNHRHPEGHVGKVLLFLQEGNDYADLACRVMQPDVRRHHSAPMAALVGTVDAGQPSLRGI